MMRLLANENFPVPSIRLLRTSGHDVAAIMEDSPGITDVEVLERAVLEARIIVTFDRDYGELIYKRKLPSPIGIIYCRFIPNWPEEAAERLLTLFATDHIMLEGQFTVLDSDHVRQKPLP
jgi:predicted nuclease of predicted toxin-antitoxin system